MGDGEGEIGEAGEEFLEGDLGFDAGELGAEAVVDAGAEGEVAIGMAVEIELVGVFEAGGVAVGGSERCEEHLTAADGVAAELGVGGDEAGLGDLGERDVAEQFLYGGFSQRPIGGELAELVGVGEKREDAVGDLVERCFVAGEEEQKDHRDELVFAETVAGFLGLNEGS